MTVESTGLNGLLIERTFRESPVSKVYTDTCYSLPTHPLLFAELEFFFGKYRTWPTVLYTSEVLEGRDSWHGPYRLPYSLDYCKDSVTAWKSG
jgi:hypothetical protein